MISERYLKYVLVAFIASGICATLLFPRHADASILTVALSTVFAIPFMSLVVTRLPVFSAFYKQDISIIDSGVRNTSDHRAASPMAGLVTAGAIALILFTVGVSNIIVPAFCGGVGAGVMSFYYAP